MSILDDLDAAYLAHRPLDDSHVWLVGGNVWHALMADVWRTWRDQPGSAALAEWPPRELFGAPVREVRGMTGWGLAIGGVPDAS